MQTVFTLSIVINNAEYARSIVIIQHKYMLMCNHRIVVNIMPDNYENSTLVDPHFKTRRAVGQLADDLLEV